jgi:hypothetical protein
VVSRAEAASSGLRIASQASGPSPAPAYADLRSRRDETGPGRSGKVAGVVDAMDGGKSAAVPLDLVNAGGAEI